MKQSISRKCLRLLSCSRCNSQKGEVAAEDFLRLLYREGRLTAAELTGRPRALKELAAGKLRPVLQVRNQSTACSALQSEVVRVSRSELLWLFGPPNRQLQNGLELAEIRELDLAPVQSACAFQDNVHG